MKDWNQSTESERVAELQHRCPDLARLLAKLEFSELPKSVRAALAPVYRETFDSFYQALAFRDGVIRAGGRADGVRGPATTDLYVDWSPANV